MMNDSEWWPDSREEKMSYFAARALLEIGESSGMIAVFERAREKPSSGEGEFSKNRWEQVSHAVAEWNAARGGHVPLID